ncbi:MAG: DEAD/DEAH box helicase [Sandaracinaceae bacterium]
MVDAPPDGFVALGAEAPPMLGAEYLDEAALEGAWAVMRDAAAEELAGQDDVLEYAASKNRSWHVVGRVVFHLAENQDDPDAPFAFLATYVDGVGPSGQPRHRPLARALEASRDDRAALTRLLRPLRDAAAESAFVAERVESGEIYHPARWSSAEAYAFLKEVPVLEATGLSVRVPDWWRARGARVRVTARVGEEAPSAGLGLAALMDFDTALALDGERLTDEERRALLSGEAGLRFLRGRWVEVDPERLSALLDHFASVQRAADAGTLTFAEGMRLLAGLGAAGDDGDDGERAPWADVVAGDWLAARVAELSDPRATRDASPGRALKAKLRPYQRDGVAWLVRLSQLGLAGCLADDMGLGKTMQVLALLLVLKKRGEGRHLLVVPASLLGNWEAEAARFAPSLKIAVAHRSRGDAAALEAAAAEADVVMTTYGTLTRTAWLKAAEWGLVVLDEAQAIKNPGTRQTRTVKALSARGRLALTGTPVENRLGDLWSLFDFLLPGLLGSAKAFTKATRTMASSGHGYAPLRRVIAPYILRRLKTDPRIVPELPDKTEVTTFCTLSKAQAALYERSVESLAREVREKEGVERRGLVLAYLQRFKQICNHPSQWLGDDGWAPDDSGKLKRLRALGEEIAERQERVLVFTQFRQATGPLARFLETVFGRSGLVLHGGTPVKRRAEMVERFAADDGPPFFVISLKAGGTGLNLTAASHVVHFDRWWNPAVENQATDRAYRIGQHRNVLVHKLVCRGTLEERIDEMIAKKQALADEVLGVDGAQALTELDDEALIALVRLDLARALDG